MNKSIFRCISICGSMSFISQMEEIATRLRDLGLEAVTPAREERQIDWSNVEDDGTIKLKREFIDGHLSKIRRSNAVLIANFTKHGIQGYVGPNTMMEAAFAHALGLPVIFLHRMLDQPGRLECMALAHGYLEGRLTALPDLLMRGTITTAQ